MLFSQRKGLKSATKLAQIDGIDEDLRNGLWDVFTVAYWEKYQGNYPNPNAVKISNLGNLFLKYWHGYFKKPIDTLPVSFAECYDTIRNYFFKCNWNELYDFVEFSYAQGPDLLADDFSKFCNQVLERENSAYRLVNGNITEITSQSEIEEVENAISATSQIKGTNEHLRAALGHLSNRKTPDYRNSIKESISAVESICQIISGNKKDSLGEALAIIGKKTPLHPALLKSFSSLYGYTSDANGIRHALMDESKLNYVDAKYMFVACTSFINYLIGKSSELGVKLS